MTNRSLISALIISLAFLSSCSGGTTDEPVTADVDVSDAMSNESDVAVLESVEPIKSEVRKAVPASEIGED